MDETPQTKPTIPREYWALLGVAAGLMVVAVILRRMAKPCPCQEEETEAMRDMRHYAQGPTRINSGIDGAPRAPQPPSSPAPSEPAAEFEPDASRRPAFRPLDFDESERSFRPLNGGA